MFDNKILYMIYYYLKDNKKCGEGKMNIKWIGSNKSIFNLILFLLNLIVLWLLPDVFKSEYLYYIWFLSAVVISIFLIVRYKSIRKLDIVIAILLGGVSILSNRFFGITAIFAYLGGQSVFRNSNNKIVPIKSGSKINIATTILLTIVTGVVLGMINLFLISTSMEKNPGFGLK